MLAIACATTNAIEDTGLASVHPLWVVHSSPLLFSSDGGKHQKQGVQVAHRPSASMGANSNAAPALLRLPCT
jgi:hypothetical protein